MQELPKYNKAQIVLFKEFTRHIISLEAFYHTCDTITEEIVNKDIEKLQKNYLNRIIDANIR